MMEFRSGYKPTDAGVFPEDWEVAPLSEIVTEFRGGAPLKPSDFTVTGVKVLPKGGVGRTGWLQVDAEDFQYCSTRYAAAHQSNQVNESHMIVVLRDLVPSGPNIGLIVQIPEAENYILAQGVYGFKVNERAVPRYLIQLSNTRWYRQLMNSIMVGSTQVHITNIAFRRAKIPLPKPSEQRAISTALSDVDELLDGLDRLIAKKRDLKQAAMQQVLTGQTRLPGFRGAWEVKRLNEVADVIDPHPSHRAPAEVSNGVPFVGIGDLDERGDIVGTKLRNVDRAVLDEHADRYNLNDQLIGLGRVASIGKVVSLKLLPEGYAISPTLGVIRGRSAKRGYLLYALRSKFITEQFTRIMSGSTRASVGMEVLRKLRVLLPPTTQEQAAIAELLMEMDSELATLEKRRGKTRALKQAMMQELLTGKTRLVSPELAHA